MAKSHKVLTAALALLLTAITTPLGLNMIPTELWSVYIVFKVWIFVGVPILLVAVREK